MIFGSCGTGLTVSGAGAGGAGGGVGGVVLPDVSTGRRYTGRGAQANVIINRHAAAAKNGNRLHILLGIYLKTVSVRF
jgi:hypothetical protein